MEEFLVKVAEILETERVTPGFRFREVEGWSSLMGFSLLVLLEQEYGRTPPVDVFMACETVSDLAKLAGVA